VGLYFYSPGFPKKSPKKPKSRTYIISFFNYSPILPSALQKIERAVKNGYTIRANPSNSLLWIANSFARSALTELFMTHPLTGKRFRQTRNNPFNEFIALYE
jgi:hypothetical protein